MSPIEPYLPYISRSPRGERGLKSLLYIYAYRRVGRSPHGERGLKCPYNRAEVFLLWSLSSRRAWIEIST